MKRGALVLLVACRASLSTDDQHAIQDATMLQLSSFRQQDAGPTRALDRAAYCALEGVELRHGIPTEDAGLACR